MKFKYRLGYYLGGFAIGLLFLFAFLGGKRASCNYWPGDRVMADIAKKNDIRLSPEIREQLKQGIIDTLDIQLILKYGDVDFSRSITDTLPCRFYTIEGKEELEDAYIYVRNCEKYVVVEEFSKN